jgi:ubiquinone/menaquinone biosynthesis C-methylase UbiE
MSQTVETASNPAETYESYMVPTLFAPWASQLIESANPRAGERVLDVATGTGIVARRVAPRVGPNGRVVALDINPGMLAVAHAAAEREGVAIEWRQGRAEELPFQEGSFDLALCQFALMFFADRPAALAEMYRVLAPGGRLAFSVFQSIKRHPFYVTLDDVIVRRLGMSGVGDIFALGDAGELRTLLAEAGFQNVQVEEVSKTARFPDPEGFLAGEIAVDTAAIPSMQHLDAQARQALIAAISEEMAGPLREITEGDYVVLPFHVYVVIASRE